jgi:hypothetical protein
MKAHILKIIVFSLFSPLLAFSQGNYKNEIGFRSDNDAYLATRQDKYYTNGLFFTFRHAVDQQKLKPALAKKTWELEVGQKMYNPVSGKIFDISEVDRPFAAYLYAGGGINWFHTNESVLRATLQTGVIGPAALGEEAQTFLHSNFGFYDITGWQFQINNEFQLNSSLSYTGLLVRDTANTFDVTTNGYANLGTTFTGAGAGAMFRLGKINELFRSVLTNSRISNSKTDTIPGGEFFVYAQPMIHAVAYDATVSGGLLREDKGPVTYGTKPIVVSQEFGVMFASKRWTLDFSIIYKSREIDSRAKPDQYASFAAFYRF